MKIAALITGLSLLFISGSILAGHDEEYVEYGPYEYHQNPYYHRNSYYRYDSYYYDRNPYYRSDNNPYYNRGVYSTGYYYDPRAAYHGAHEEGAGEHVPTGSVASPYDHGVHHGYHRSDEEGWHSGTHYGHE